MRTAKKLYVVMRVAWHHRESIPLTWHRMLQEIVATGSMLSPPAELYESTAFHSSRLDDTQRCILRKMVIQSCSLLTQDYWRQNEIREQNRSVSVYKFWEEFSKGCIKNFDGWISYKMATWNSVSLPACCDILNSEVFSTHLNSSSQKYGRLNYSEHV